jgi:hypothetical protein
VLDNASYLKSVPGLEALIKDIGAAHPIFAMAEWSDLIRAQIFTIEGDLDLLPYQQTGVRQSLFSSAKRGA